MSAVSDSSPLISLAAIGSLDLLKSLYGTVYIPEAVYEEVVVSGKGKPGAKEVSGSGWIQRQEVRDKSLLKKLTSAGLDEGESQAIALAKELDAQLLIVDDYEARAAAQQIGIRVTGTLGVLLAAKEEELIKSVRTKLEALLQAGFYILPSIYKETLRRAREKSE